MAEDFEHYISTENVSMSAVESNIRDDILNNRLSFEFPSGMNKIDLLEEVRALTNPDDLATIESVFLQKLEGKTVNVYLKNYDGKKELLFGFAVTRYDMDLSAVSELNQYPCIYEKMLETFSNSLKKKFPMPKKATLK